MKFWLGMLVIACISVVVIILPAALLDEAAETPSEAYYRGVYDSCVVALRTVLGVANPTNIDDWCTEFTKAARDANAFENGVPVLSDVSG